MNAWRLFFWLAGGSFSLLLHSEAKIAADFGLDHRRIPIARTRIDLR